MSQLPTWAQWMQFTATGIIAIFATFIAYRQWRTARDRVILDLFERRMMVYDAARDVMGQIAREGTADNKIFFDYVRATDRLKMLFGNEVLTYANQTRERLNKFVYHEKMVKALIDKPEQAKAYELHVDASAELSTQLMKFYDEFSELVMPYVRMTQKRGW